MDTVLSPDGTRIAYDRTGTGPALVIAVGAFCTRQTTRALTAALAEEYTVYEYDRRGRGDSTDAGAADSDDTAIDREVADFSAVVAATGQAPLVYGHSSGAIIALEAAARGVPLHKVIAYEPPYTQDGGPTRMVAAELRALVAAGHPDQAAARFLTLTGLPPAAIESMRAAPFWAGLVALAHTLHYDVALCNDGTPPTTRLADSAVPTLALYGGVSAPWAEAAAAVLAAGLPHATKREVPGQDHNLADDALLPVLREFFGH